MVIAVAALLTPVQRARAQAIGVDAPYVPTPWGVVEAMLQLGKVGPQDFVIDLGSGDGRIVITAARKFGARGFGVDIDGSLVGIAQREARRQGVASRVEFHEQNLYLTDISRATVLTMYLVQRMLMELRPRLIKELKPGTRVVSHDFDMGDWKPDAHVTVPVPEKPYGPPTSEVYLWVVPANAAGTWRWRSTLGGGPVDIELGLQQTFQMLEGGALVGGRMARFEGGRMHGEQIRFMLIAEIQGRAVRHEFIGRVDGDSVSGKVKLAGGGEADWSATRVRRGKIEQR
ncbi:MAG: class I SAM-dependent methyltransferase [Betaproteobacteria bacterium]|nr:class I SAM-dependent methyltransferase [Betaproteobacteria bacterium]